MSAAFKKTAVQVSWLPKESRPVPFHSVPLLIPPNLVAEAGNVGSVKPLPKPPGKPPVLRVVSPVVAGLCLLGLGA